MSFSNNLILGVKCPHVSDSLKAFRQTMAWRPRTLEGHEGITTRKWDGLDSFIRFKKGQMTTNAQPLDSRKLILTLYVD